MDHTYSFLLFYLFHKEGGSRKLTFASCESMSSAAAYSKGNDYRVGSFLGCSPPLPNFFVPLFLLSFLLFFIIPLMAILHKKGVVGMRDENVITCIGSSGILVGSLFGCGILFSLFR
ncbi:hypothetical protein AVEN_202303-1 [Araneus ventricosus]|uniref:Uncharacterized protein n=1 Tax=Araneus ventricosus TaxID=182803 RepID=A0A4Y2I2Y9_ARAVE|nr:hypothetical protein AVEN_202303-1 [Araneus ventricosus]